MHFREIDLTQIITALGMAVPAIIAAILSCRTHATLKQHELDQKRRTTKAIEDRNQLSADIQEVKVAVQNGNGH